MDNNIDEIRRSLLEDIAELERKIMAIEIELGISASSLQKLNQNESVKLGEVSTVPMVNLNNTNSVVISGISKGSVPDIIIPKGSSNIITSQESFISAIKNSIKNNNIVKNEEKLLTSNNEQLLPNLITENKSKPQNNQVVQNTIVNTVSDNKQVKTDINKEQDQKSAQITKNQQQINYGPQDIPSLALLIKKIGDLIETNEKIAYYLEDIIETTKNMNYSTRLSSLINKLANVALNG